ncbi:GGDEF domain-containing protein [Rummeliibacillus stabekisii]|uniref:GGDEF domain-containing protein n=1 Tax=Rummeliibacillus stabekisii TaxID=241244 RepID=A0A143HGK7_9BACL|nr:GGDEF domain-containing protein [Rummeliibacillus stabekisii]AMX00859.1 hypothetical protein ATY39_16620 [Rummeliibacillus stabekisii]
MFLEYAVYFSLLFTFVISFYLAYQLLEQSTGIYKEFHPWIVGFAASITGLLLMKASTHFKSEYLINGDLRNVLLLLSGWLGGPISMGIAATLIGITRIYISGLSEISIHSGILTIIVGLILSLLAWWKPIKFRNLHYYLLLSILFYASSIALNAENWLISAVLLFIISIPALYITAFVIRLLNNQFNKIHTIEKMVETDFLTGLPNIRKCKCIIDRYIQSEIPFALLLIDIDQFSKINMKHGVMVGDQFLRKIGELLKEFNREHPGSTSIRISGEEFYLICKDLPPASSLQYAYDISKSISKMSVDLEDGSSASISVSVGIANYPENGKTIYEIAQSTHDAFRLATTKGNNQIVHYNQIPKTPVPMDK